MPKRPGRKSAAQTPAPRSERIYGSKKNKPGSASGQSEAKISLSPQIKKALKKKADEFNEKHPTKRVRVTTLEKVFRRGAGAYSKSHRPTITGNVPNTRSAWSFARVNKFLKKKSGQKVKAAYVQDDDLLMDGGEVMAKGGEVKKLAAGYYEGIYNGVKFTITHQDQNAYGGKPMWYFQINDGPVDDLFSTKAQAIQAAKQIIDENFAKGGEVKFNDKELLAKYNRGESIGFTAVAHLKAKGLIPRADGTKRKSEKYLEDGGLLAPNNDGGVVFVRNKNYDNSQTIRRLPYRGVSAFAVATDDFEKFKQYAEKEEGVDPSNWQVYDMDDFDNYQVCALKMSETNDYVMGWSDEKPKLEPFDAQEHTMYIDEDGNLDYDDAHEIIILPTKTMDRGGMTAIFVNNMLESAKDIDNIIEYALENDIKPTDPEFNTKVNPDGKYSAFEIRLAKRELKKYSHGGELPMQVTCKKCGWSWNTADSQPQDATMCHKCGFDNVSEDIISMNAPTYLRSLEFAREDAKEDVDLHKVTENAVALSKEHPIRMKEYDELVKLENGGVDEYADGGQFFSYEPKEYDIQEFICKEQDLADVLSNNGDMTRLGKIRICKAKINLAEDKLKNATSDREVEAWYMSTCIWTDCMNGLKSNYKSGGKVGGCGCYKDGGLAYGNSHDKGGMPLTVKSTGQNIEIEGGEGVVNKRSMQMNKTVEFQGKKLTPCEVVSKINEMGGGVKFKCDDVKKIIAEDGHFD